MTDTNAQIDPAPLICPNCAGPLEAVTGCCRDTTCGESPDYDESLPDLAPPPVDSPLDLAQFDGHTPGPWSINSWPQRDDKMRIGAAGVPEIAALPLQFTSINAQKADAALIAAAPALLAECKRQREEIARLRASLTETLRALEAHLDEDTNAHGLKHRDILCSCNRLEVKRAHAALAALPPEPKL